MNTLTSGVRSGIEMDPALLLIMEQLKEMKDGEKC
jgi:hypothetical protein